MVHAQVPIYAHVKEVVDPQGRLTAVEINYVKFLAFNGSYKVHQLSLPTWISCKVWHAASCQLTLVNRRFVMSALWLLNALD